MSAAIPVADMCSGAGELSAALQATIRDDRGRLHPAFAEWMMGLPPAETLPRATRIRLAGNAVVAPQAALMLTRGLEQLNATNQKEIS